MTAEKVTWFPVSQRSFGDLGGTRVWPPAKRTRYRRLKMPEEIKLFETRLRLRGYAAGTIQASPTNVFDILQNAARIANVPVTVAELINDIDRLAEAACERRSLRPGDAIIRPTTLQARRTSVRQFFRTCFDVLDIDPEEAVSAFDEALTRRAMPVGRAYRLFDPSPFEPLPSPSPSEIQAMLARAAVHPESFLAARDVAFIACIATLGLRLFSIVNIDGSDFKYVSSKLMLLVREKGNPEEQWIPIPHELKELLEAYVGRFNSLTAHKAQPIGIGQSGRFWRGRWGRPWSPEAARVMSKRVSREVASQQYPPHALRRSLHRQLLEAMPREFVSLALRRTGTAVMDKYYGPTPGSTNWRETPTPDPAPDRKGDCVTV